MKELFETLIKIMWQLILGIGYAMLKIVELTLSGITALIQKGIDK